MKRTFHNPGGSVKASESSVELLQTQCLLSGSSSPQNTKGCIALGPSMSVLHILYKWVFWLHRKYYILLPQCGPQIIVFHKNWRKAVFFKFYWINAWNFMIKLVAMVTPTAILHVARKLLLFMLVFLAILRLLCAQFRLSGGICTLGWTWVHFCDLWCHLCHSCSVCWLPTFCLYSFDRQCPTLGSYMRSHTQVTPICPGLCSSSHPIYT